ATALTSLRDSRDAGLAVIFSTRRWTMNGRATLDRSEGLRNGELAALRDAFRPALPSGRSRTAPTGNDAALTAQPAPAAPDNLPVPLKDLVEMLLAGVAAARDNGQAQLFAGAAIAAACCSVDADALPEALRKFAPCSPRRVALLA